MQAPMNRFRSALTVFSAVLLGGSVCVAWQNQQWHTRPDKWDSPRRFQTPFLDRYDDRVLIRHTTRPPDSIIRVPSPNEAYWFGISPDWNVERPAQSSVRFHLDSPDARIYVFNERDDLIEIILRDHYPNFQISANWINEKLIFIRVWWGRVLGSDLIFDVERESFIYREMVNDGVIPFMQWQGQKKK